jgi:hypothetical protein
MAGEEKEKQHWIWTVLQWAGPLLLSVVVGYGSLQYGQGARAAQLTTLERDLNSIENRVEKAEGEHGNYVTRDEFKLILDDLKEIKTDVREVRRSLAK